MRKILFLILILASACSPQKRLARLLKKHPELVSTVNTSVIVKDTIMDSDTFVYPGFTDSFSITSDTILKKGKFSLKKSSNNYSLQVYPDTLYSTDTIYYEKVVTVPGKVLQSSKTLFDDLKTISFIAIILLIITALILNIKNLIKAVDK